MKFRYARHTNNLEELIYFYTNIIGLKILGTFENHANYNGVFLGYPSLDWHIEFTQSDEQVNHKSDDDDLLVFYFNSQEEINTIKKKAVQKGIHFNKSKNPYWQNNGIEILDPDGYGVILTLTK